MFKVIRKSEASIRKIADNKTATNYITKDISSQMSFATIEAIDYFEKETSSYNRIYYVLKGTLQLMFGKQEISLQGEDSCFVEKGTTYEMKGTFKAIVVNQPAFGA